VTRRTAHSLRRARQQLCGFLLRQGCHYRRPAWTKLHRRWLAGFRFGQAVHHIVLEDYIAAIGAFRCRIIGLWHRLLCRRSQKKGRMVWQRMTKLADEFLPKPRVLHPWPSVGFAVRHPR